MNILKKTKKAIRKTMGYIVVILMFPVMIALGFVMVAMLGISMFADKLLGDKASFIIKISSHVIEFCWDIMVSLGKTSKIISG